MSKVACDRVRELLGSSEDLLLHDLVLEIRRRVRDVVRERLEVFGSAGACTLSGNICPAHGVCGAQSAKTVESTVRPKPNASQKSPLRDNKVVAAVVAQVVSEVLKEMGK
jgi:fructose-bisphosphate aldolase class II